VFDDLATDRQADARPGCLLVEALEQREHPITIRRRSGLITPLELAGLDLWELVRESIGWHTETLDELTRHRLIRRLIGLEVADLVQATDRRIAEAEINSVEALQRLPHNVVGWSDEWAAQNRQLKHCLFGNMYRHYRVVRMQVKAENILSDLFQSYNRQPAQLPPEVQQRAEEKNDLPHAVCDYLAGMTDRFALDEHYKLFDPRARP
jgi:dGTPase